MRTWQRLRVYVLTVCVLLAPLLALSAQPPAVTAARLASDDEATPAAITAEPDFAPCPADSTEVAQIAGTLRRDRPPHEQQISLDLDAPSVITVLGYVKEGHPESCPGGYNCGQGQLHEEIKVLVDDELIGEHRDRGDVDEWFVAGPWLSETRPEGATTVTVAHRMEGTTAESVSFKLTVCARPPAPVDDRAPTITRFTLNDGAATTSSREVQVGFEAVDPAPSSGWGLVRFDELERPGGPVLTEGEWRAYAGGLLSTALTLDGPAGVRAVRATVCDAANNCASAETSIILAGPDTVAPCVTGLSLDGGAAQTSADTIAINVTAEDEAPGSVAEVRFAEYFYSEGTWLPTAASRKAPWLPYDPATTYTWRLSNEPGLKYIQAWARDGAGNISPPACAQQASINRVGCAALPVGDKPDSIVYRYDLAIETLVKMVLTSTSGDADLYVYPPDYDDGRPPWVSNLPAPEVDQVSFTTPVAGAYQVEVVRYSTAASYCLEVIIDAPAPTPGPPVTVAALAKPRLAGPTVDLNLRPALVWPLPAGAGNEIYIPFVAQ